MRRLFAIALCYHGEPDALLATGSPCPFVQWTSVTNSIICSFKQANSRGSCVKSKSIFCITKHLCQIAFGKKLDRPDLANGLSGFKCLIYSV